MPSASVVLIGNEILTGKFADENGPYLIGRLRTLGVDLHKLVVIPDVVEVIADEVRRASEASDHVFTTGGVGPTHDDVTFDGVAAAFGVPLQAHEGLLRLMAGAGLDVDGPARRMATLPEGAELVMTPGVPYPVIRVRNVWVLPGVPPLVKQKFEAIAPRLAGQAVRWARVYALDRETEVADAMTAVVEAHPDVEIGSYPRWGNADHKLIVTFEGRDLDAVHAAVDALLPHLDVVRVEREGDA